MSHQDIPIAAVVGWPIAHSLSPRLHGHWLKRYGINGHYVPLAVAPDDFPDALRMMPKLGFKGTNVTIPHKEAALAVADTATERATRIGAANTLTFGADRKIHADNTDGFGFLENLKDGHVSWDPKAGPAFLLGAGGAAKAIAVALQMAGVPKLLISNRTGARADELAKALSGPVDVVDWDTVSDAVQGNATIVNTTSLGMTGQPPLSISLKSADPGTLVTDIVYVPRITDLLAEAQSLGLPNVDGLGMLLHQAVPGFEAWFGKKPQVDAELRTAVLASS